MKAVNSIPAYIERSTHFFAVCPTIRHQDLTKVTCDYGSWSGRGWCRLELLALWLARYSNLSGIVVKGGEAAPFMIPAISVMTSLPGEGTFTCCARNHNIGGVEIKCDRIKIGNVISSMVTKRIQYHLGREEMQAFRLWKAARSVFLVGLPQLKEHKLPQCLESFLREFKFAPSAKSSSSLSKNGSAASWTPLVLACISSNLPVVRELVEDLGVDVNVRMGFVDRTMGFPRDCTALHYAAYTGRHVVKQIVELLVQAGADLNDSRNQGGWAPLFSAVYRCNAGGRTASDS